MSLASREARGYGYQHRAERARWQTRLDRGLVVECARVAIGECTHPEDLIDYASPWDLGHTDDRTAWTGPEHVDCNRRAGGANGNRVQRERRETIVRSWG